MKLGYTLQHCELLAEIRQHVLQHPEFYLPGADLLGQRYGPDYLHQEQIVRWQNQQRTMRHYAEETVAPDWEPDEIDWAERGFARYYNVVPPVRERWTPAACACYAVQDLLAAEGSTHNDSRAKAILIMAVLMWDEEAHRRHPLLAVFGDWGVDALGDVETIGRWAAACSLDDERIGNWMDLVQATWTALPKPPQSMNAVTETLQIEMRDGVQQQGMPTAADRDDRGTGIAQSGAQFKLSPSRVRAKAAYEWALETIPGAEVMTLTELHEAILNHPQGPTECIPESAASFARYLRGAGVARYDRRGKRCGRSIKRSEEL